MSRGSRLALVAGVAALLIGGVAESLAQRRGITDNAGPGGYCPAGTCAKNGTSFAANVKNCRKEYCAKR